MSKMLNLFSLQPQFFPHLKCQTCSDGGKCKILGMPIMDIFYQMSSKSQYCVRQVYVLVCRENGLAQNGQIMLDLVVESHKERFCTNEAALSILETQAKPGAVKSFIHSFRCSLGNQVLLFLHWLYGTAKQRQFGMAPPVIKETRLQRLRVPSQGMFKLLHQFRQFC